MLRVYISHVWRWWLACIAWHCVRRCLFQGVEDVYLPGPSPACLRATGTAASSQPCHLNRSKQEGHASRIHTHSPPLPPSLPSTGPHAMQATHHQQRSLLRPLLPVLLLLSSACLLLPTSAEQLLESAALAHPPALYINEGPSSTSNQPGLPTLWAGILDLSKPCQQGE